MYTGATPAKLPDKMPAAVESSPHACFCLTESLAFCYCNPAWDSFARENGGTANVLAASVLHKPFLELVPEALRANFEELFHRVRALGRLQSQDYECSSAKVFRLYRMQVYPLKPGSGFVVINSLRIVHPHTREVCEPDDASYRCTHGLIHMCANCRRTRRNGDPEIWDWVPAYVEHPRADVTHTICPFCREYYYSAYLPGGGRT
jgi:hypothetical protein